MKTVGAIEVQQTLHGYNNGHNLLCASRPLPATVAREMLVLSDLSGSRAEPGFETYLTAYPLPEIGSYALARTWVAPEMKRPGCVWTHTLLIEFADLARFETPNQLRDLLDLLERPSSEGDTDLSRYKTSAFWTLPLAEISLSADDVDKDLLVSDLARYLLLGLYFKPLEPVFLLAEDAAQYEELVFRLWLQQWPRLRRQFAFCTGVGANRKHAKQSFDLQIAPTRKASSLKHELPSSTLLRGSEIELGKVGNSSLDLSTPKNADEDFAWLEVAMIDLALTNSNQDGSFREFLRFWGADAKADRAQYALLGNMFAALKEVNRNCNDQEQNLLDFLESMAQAFPQVKQAQKLKAQTLGQTAPNRILKVSETEVLKALVSTPYYRIFDANSLHIQSRVAALWQQDSQQEQNAAQTLLLDSLQGAPNPLLDEIITAFARSATPAQATAVADRVPSLAVPFVRQNPALLFSPELWHGSPDLRRELLDDLKASNLSHEQQQLISVMIFETGASDLADDLEFICGAVAAHSILEHLAATPRILDEPWKRMLIRHADELTHWLQEQISLPALPESLVIQVLVPLLLHCDPASREFDAIGLQNWVSLLSTCKMGQQNQTATDVEAERLFSNLSVWILTAAFSRSGHNASLLVERTFHTAHHALAQQNVSFFIWKWLEKGVPALPYKEWDRCERLRLALVDQFAKKKWPLAQFTGAIKDEDTLHNVIMACRQTHQGQEIFKRVRRQVKDGEITVSSWQQSFWVQKKKTIWSFLDDLLT